MRGPYLNSVLLAIAKLWKLEMRLLLPPYVPPRNNHMSLPLFSFLLIFCILVLDYLAH